MDLSVNDGIRIIYLQNQDITPKMIEVLKKYNNKDTTDIKQFKFGYVKRQILEGYLNKKDLFHPVKWHEDGLKKVYLRDFRLTVKGYEG